MSKVYFTREQAQKMGLGIEQVLDLISNFVDACREIERLHEEISRLNELLNDGYQLLEYREQTEDV